MFLGVGGLSTVVIALARYSWRLAEGVAVQAPLSYHTPPYTALRLREDWKEGNKAMSEENDKVVSRERGEAGKLLDMFHYHRLST